MSNPFESFVEEYGTKKAAIGMAHLPGRLGGGIVHGLGAAAAAGVVGGVGLAASHIYNAATKSRDFRNMLEYNPDLVEHHERDPRMFNQMFTSLRTMNPAFSKDPLVAGTYMRQMIDSPMSAGGILANTIASRDKFTGPMDRALEEGIGAGGRHFTPERGQHGHYPPPK